MFFLSVLPKPPTLTSSANSSVQPTGTKVTLTCKTTSSGSVSYKFYKNDMEIEDIGNSGRTGSYVIPSTDGKTNSFTCKTVINGVTSAASSAVSVGFTGKFKVQLFLLFIYINLKFENLFKLIKLLKS